MELKLSEVTDRGYTAQWSELPVARKPWGTNFQSLMPSLGGPTLEAGGHTQIGCTKAHLPPINF